MLHSTFISKWFCLVFTNLVNILVFFYLAALSMTVVQGQIREQVYIVPQVTLLNDDLTPITVRSICNTDGMLYSSIKQNLTEPERARRTNILALLRHDYPQPLSLHSWTNKNLKHFTQVYESARLFTHKMSICRSETLTNCL